MHNLKSYLWLKCIIIILIVWHSLDGYSQRERVHLDLDKYSCRAGDTIYFRGVVIKGMNPSPSTNLYTSLYTEDGILLQRYLSPIVRGQAIGQIILPDTLPTDNYYILALTKEQLNYDTSDFFSVPVLVYNRDKPALRSHKRQTPSPESTTAGTINGVTWITSLYQGQLSSMLTVDSGSLPRNLQVIDLLTKDSVLSATVGLSNTVLQKYCLFPVDTARDSAVLLLFEDSTLIGRQLIRLKDLQRPIQFTADTLDTEAYGYNSWKLDLPGPTAWSASIDVTDADRSLPSPAPITWLNDSHTDNFTIAESLIDTAYISYSGKATRVSGKRIKDPFSQQIVVAGVRDSNYVFTKVVNIDARGNFKLDSLNFDGPIELRFQINKEEDGSTKDVKLSLARFVPPAVDASALRRDWEDDTVIIGKKDTVITPTEQKQYELAKFKTLKPAIVRAWKNPRKELDDRYTTGPFSEPALYVYDLRRDSSDYNRDVFWYLNANSGRLHYDPICKIMTDDLGHPINYFIDEMEYDPDAVKMLDFDKLAYIKIFENDFLSNQRPISTLISAGSGPFAFSDQKTALNICVYTRKGNDFRTMRGGMNKTAITGYNKVFPFTTDKVTLFWHPQEYGHSFNIRFNNAETAKRFRVKVEAISQTGEVIHYETVISRDNCCDKGSLVEAAAGYSSPSSKSGRL